ncbi:MAG: EAL domain-containing protein [Frankiales bacterium]|nr:EAL domain-containing protein [Frankiales bacterium]
MAGVLLALRTSERWSQLWLRSAFGIDLVLYLLYSVLFSQQPGANTFYPILVLLAGPVLWGWRGLPWSAVPVGIIASLWPQQDALGATSGPWEVWTLVALLSVPAAGLSSLVHRGGARLSRAEEQFRTAFQDASSAMALLDRDHVILRANSSLHLLLGRRELVGTVLPDHLRDPDCLRRGLAVLSDTERASRFELELGRVDGQNRWVSVVASAIGAPGNQQQIVLQAEDITDRRLLEERLAYEATHDLLTGLPNGRALTDRLTAALQAGERPAVLFVDLDRFKLVNDSLGHAAGDRLLITAARRLRSCVRPEDLVARLGGDEFVVVCDGSERARAAGVAARLLEALRPEFRADTVGLNATGSVGVALACEQATVETLLRDADTAMYAAKRAGGNQAVVFTDHLRAEVVRRQELESGLRRALAAGQLTLHYQPIVNGAGQVRAAEALLRWCRNGEDMNPAELIAVAEQSDLILDLGAWVLRQGLQDSASWPPDVRLHVNVSARQLDAGFAATVRGLLTEFQPPTGTLCLELTETAVSDDLEGLVVKLEVLRRLGVRLAIDDFGVGNASLTYLARLPVQEIKIDRSFVMGMPSDAGSAAIVAAVLAMAQAYGMDVIAEGVETREQDLAVVRLGCTARQGFLHHRPLPAGDLQALWSRQQGPPVVPPQPRLTADGPVLSQALSSA